MKASNSCTVSLNDLNSIKKREIILKHISKIGLQKVHTPLSLANYMVPKDLQGTVCVIFNLEFLEILRFVRKYDMSKVTFFADSEEEVIFAKKVYNVENTYLINEDTWNKIIKKEVNVGEIFMSKMKEAADVTFSNPPYENKDLKIIKALAEANCLKKLICVHPSTWLVETKSRLGIRCMNLFKDFRNLVREHLVRVEIFDGTKVFNIGLNADCIISNFNFSQKRINQIKVKYLNKTNFIDISDIDDISIHTDSWEYIKQLIEKLNNYIKINESFESKRISAIEALAFHKNKIFTQISMIRTQKRNEKNSNCFTFSSLNVSEPKIVLKGDAHPSTGKSKEDLIEKIIPRSISNKIPNEIVFIFKSENEKENFLKTIKTDFMRLCLSIIKTNSNLNSGELSFVPWLDWSKSWTDDELFTFFGFEKEHPLRNYTKNFINDYYKIGKNY